MSDNTFITADIDTSTAMRQLILKLESIEHPECMLEIAEETKKYFNQFVPSDTGALRRSADTSESTWKKSVVRWTAPYAPYQYSGTVFVPNIPTFDSSGHSGWTSVKGRKKVPAIGKGGKARKMGEQTGTFVMKYGPNAGKVVSVDGYSTDGTGADWIRVGKYEHAEEYRNFRRTLSATISKFYYQERRKYYG